jgi:hypothetical protein
MAACLAGCPRSQEYEQSCSDDDPPEGDAVLELLSEGDSLEDGSELSLDYGSQGGQHFYFTVRAFGVGTDELVLARFEATDENQGIEQIFFDQPCGSWSVVENQILQVNSASASSGPFRVELGKCNGACEFDADGRITNFVVRASREARIVLVP